VKETDPDTLRRAAAFLILADSRSSFEIEKERPAEDRVQRWGRSLARAGREQLSVDALNRLQAEVLGEATHARHGLRSEGVFLGAHDRYGTPMPEFIGARPEDVRELVDGLLAYNQILSRDKAYDPVVHAAGLAFGFVFVHPYEDGNGRLHRYLVHDVLTARGFSPPGIVFPVSKAILDRIEDYVRVLRDHSAPLLDYIPWKSTPTGNVEVYGDTVDLYRYPDVTRQAEFLFECIAHTVDHTFPEEVSYIESWDRAMAAAAQVVEMPNNRLQQFIGHVVRNNGVLPKTRRKRDFSDLPPDVVEELETAIREAFMLPEPPAEGPAAPTL